MWMEKLESHKLKAVRNFNKVGFVACPRARTCTFINYTYVACATEHMAHPLLPCYGELAFRSSKCKYFSLHVNFPSLGFPPFRENISDSVFHLSTAKHVRLSARTDTSVCVGTTSWWVQLFSTCRRWKAHSLMRRAGVWEDRQKCPTSLKNRSFSVCFL